MVRILFELLATEAIRGFSEVGIGEGICVRPGLDRIRFLWLPAVSLALANIFIDHALINLEIKLVVVEEYHAPPDAAY